MIDYPLRIVANLWKGTVREEKNRERWEDKCKRAAFSPSCVYARSRGGWKTWTGGEGFSTSAGTWAANRKQKHWLTKNTVLITGSQRVVDPYIFGQGFGRLGFFGFLP